MMPKTETSGDDAAEEWSIPVNWEEDPAIKAKPRTRYSNFHFPKLLAQEQKIWLVHNIIPTPAVFDCL